MELLFVLLLSVFRVFDVHFFYRNSESSIAMRAHGNGVRGLASPDRGGTQDRKVNGSHHHQNHHNNNHSSKNHHLINDNNNGSASSDSKKGGSSSGSDAIPVVWPPKFVIALTNKEKEEDFLAIKGSKLPQRPKKRAKFIQRTLNVSFLINFLAINPALFRFSFFSFFFCKVELLV